MDNSMMSRDNYPTLYRSASAASRKAQRDYLLLNRVYLGSLMLGSVTSMFTVIGSEALNTCLYTVMAVVLVVGLLMLWVIRAKQDDKIWFDGRAIAESVKTITWRFMMGGFSLFMKTAMLIAPSLPASEKYARQGRIWGNTSPPQWTPLRVGHNQFYEREAFLFLGAAP